MMAKLPDMKAGLRSLFSLNDAFFFTGVALLTIGAAQIYAPVGYLVPGAIFTWLGVRK